jgi:xanthine dehydrogenase accessory factor
VSSGFRGLVVVRGAGDLASGAILRLSRSGFRVAALEIAEPMAIRRGVAFSEAVYDGEVTVEGLTARRAASARDVFQLSNEGVVPILVDPLALSLPALSPLALVDAILAKRNLGTNPGMAPIVVALGPGFEAPRDAFAVVETNRGHDLGRVIMKGSAEADTGVPGTIGGRSSERVVRAPIRGRIEALRAIGDIVAAGDPIFAVRDLETGLATVARSPIDGALRGLIRHGIEVEAGLKAADVDPRGEISHCFTVSDKARAVAGGVLEALLALGARPD